MGPLFGTQTPKEVLERFKMCEKLDPTVYQGNGWSQYQMYVLKQLDDHNKILEKLVDKLGHITTQLELRQQELDAVKKEFRSINDNLDVLAEEDEKIAKVLQAIETDKVVAIKTKAVWASIGGGAIAVLSILLQVIGHALKFVN